MAKTAELKVLSASRQSLKDGATVVGKAQRAVDDATDIVARAQADLDASRKRLEGFADLDARIVRSRVENLKAGKASDALPGELVDQQRERLSSQEQVGHAENTLTVVKGELADKRLQLEEALRGQSSAAVVVFNDQLDLVIQQYWQAYDAMMQFKILLESTPFSGFSSHGWTYSHQDQRSVQLSTVVRNAGLPFGSIDDVTAIQSKIAGSLSGKDAGVLHYDEQRSQARRYWSDLAAAILRDPDANLELPQIGNVSPEN